MLLQTRALTLRASPGLTKSLSHRVVSGAPRAAPRAASVMSGPQQMPEAYPHGIKTLSPGNTIVEALALIGPNFQVVPLDGDSPYVKARTALYDFNGKQRRWDVVESHPSVGIVLYHRDLDAFILVRQFRPAVYASLCREAQAAGAPLPTFKDGFTYELCAGLIDKGGKSNEEIASEEIEEECGFRVPPSQIMEVGIGIASAGTQGVKHIVYYAEVDGSMAIPGGGGGLLAHGECIEVLALPFDSSQAFVMDGSQPKSPGLMFGVTWAYFNKINGTLGTPRRAQGAGANGLMTEELTLKPVLPA